MPPACLTFSDLTLGYNSHPAIHHLDGVVRKGSLTAVVGANGSGKSTLMKGIVGMLKPMSGTISRLPGTRIAYLPQQSELDRSFPARVIDLVSLGLWPRRGLLGRHTPQDRESVSKALMAVGTPDALKKAVGQISSGLERDRENAAGYRYLAQAYGELGDIPRAELATAEGHYYSGAYQDAKIFAARAQRKFKRGEPGWLRAQDIINFRAPGKNQ